ncbi:hypothetical protein [Clostridium manihotivorum]|uniref:hypothetical protein n=1 Tax=Clostridium manihotivorum TaxID=2320868 RepID=UPI00196B5715|nr:hypothetical protein [Clostridium manihotivorum]
MLLVIEIIGLLCMLTIMFVAIWGFIIARFAYSQIKYQNYLLEKLTQNIYLLVTKTDGIIDRATLNTNNDVTEYDSNENKNLDGQI